MSKLKKPETSEQITKQTNEMRGEEYSRDLQKDKAIQLWVGALRFEMNLRYRNSSNNRKIRS